VSSAADNDPPTEDDDLFPPRFWSRSTLKREESIRMWSTENVDKESLTPVELKQHIACVDAVLLFNVRLFYNYLSQKEV
jgi:hypothetical protein